MGLRDVLRLPAAVAVVAVVAVLAACGEESATTAPDEPTQTESWSPTSAALADAAVDDLVQRLTVEPGEVEVLEVEQVTWNDGSLGCPQPGEVYTQAQVEGHRVLLAAQGRTWPYHSGGGRGPFLCENLQPSTPPDPGGEQ